MQIELKKGTVEAALTERAIRLFGFASANDFLRAAIQAHYQSLMDIRFEEVGLWSAEAITARDNATASLKTHTPDPNFTVDDLRARVKALREKAHEP